MLIMHQPYHITKREQEILVLVCSGKTASQIAQQLEISPSTVESHKKNICNKFNVRNSVQLAVMAAELGYVSKKDLLF